MSIIRIAVLNALLEAQKAGALPPLDDGQYFIAQDNTLETSNGRLMRRGVITEMHSNGESACIGQYRQGDSGLWHVEITTIDGSASSSTTRVVGDYAGRIDAITELWLARPLSDNVILKPEIAAPETLLHPVSALVFDEKININQGGLSILVVLGVILCFTGIGALLGLPMIYAGVKGNKGGFRGPCPLCRQEILMNKQSLGFNCPVCKNRLIRNNTNLEVAP